MGRLEDGEQCGSSIVALPDSTPSQRIPDTLIDEDEPQSLVGSVDATDGIGSIRFSDEENAGFFGTPFHGLGLIPCRLIRSCCRTFFQYRLHARHRQRNHRSAEQLGRKART